MSFSRTIVSSFARAAPRPQVTRVTVNNNFASFRARVAAMSTISDVIIKDHRELEQYYNEVINSDDVDHKTRFGNQFTWELARHSVAEELLIYPAMEKYIGGKEGKEHAEKDRQQHHQVKELLKEFQNMKATDSGYVPKLKELWAILGQHIKEEEQDDLPALESALSKADKGTSESLAKNFGRTKMFVPSRSHPSAGENPLFEGPMGMLAAPLDHIADLFRKFPDNTISPNPSKK